MTALFVVLLLSTAALAALGLWELLRWFIAQWAERV